MCGERTDPGEANEEPREAEDGIEPPGPDAASPTRVEADAGPGPLAGARRFVRRHRTRLMRLFLVGFAALVLVDLAGVLPTTVEVELPLGADHADADALVIDVLDATGEPVRSVRLRHGRDASGTVPLTLDLPPGRYLVRVEAVRADGSRSILEGPLEAPAEGTVRVPLAPAR